MLKVIGLVLIGLGVLALAYGGFKYTTREKVVDVGPVHIAADREKEIPFPPWAGAGAVGAGVILLLIPRRKK